MVKGDKMNKSKKIKIDQPKLQDTTATSISTHNIIPSGRDFCEDDKQHWVEKMQCKKNADEDKKSGVELED